MLTSYGSDFASQWGAAVRDLLEEFGPQVFDVTVSNSSSAAASWSIEGHKGGMYAVGAGAAITGRGANVLIIDDPIKGNEDASSITLKDKLWQWFGCFHPDHDLLTTEGWVRIQDVTTNHKVATVNTDTLEISYESPSAVQKYKYDDDLYSYETPQLKFCVTPNHNMWCWGYKDTLLTNYECQKLPVRCTVPQRFTWTGQKCPRTFLVGKYKYQTKGLFAFLGYILFRGPRFDKGVLTLSCVNPHFETLLKKWRIPYRKNKSVYRFGKCLSKYIIELNGRLSRNLKSFSREYLQYFLEYFTFASSEYDFNSRKAYWTIKNKNQIICDDLVEIALKCGYKVSYMGDVNIKFSQTEEKQITPWSKYNTIKGIEKVEYKGFVHCVTMPTHHTVITRYKGCISLSGQSVASTRLQPGGKSGICCIQTRWSHDDLAGRLIDNMNNGGEKWEVVNFPAIAEEDEAFRKQGEALWPELWSIDELLKIKNGGVLSTYDWASLYQQRPVPQGGGLFKSNWIRYFTEEPSLYNLNDGNFVEKNKCWKFVTVDMANKPTVTSDYTVIAIWAVTPKNDLLLLNLFREHYNYDEVLKQLIFVFKEDSPKYIGIENMGVGIQLINEARVRGLPVRALEPHGRGKQNRAAAPLGAVVRMESGKVFFRKGQKWLHDLETELMYFPKGKHDDCVDVLSYACNELSKLNTYEDGDFMPYDLENIIGIKKAGNMRILY